MTDYEGNLKDITSIQRNCHDSQYVDGKIYSTIKCQLPTYYEAKLYRMPKYLGYGSPLDIGKMPYKDIQRAIIFYREDMEDKEKKHKEQQRRDEIERKKSSKKYKNPYKRSQRKNYKGGKPNFNY